MGFVTKKIKKKSRDVSVSERIKHVQLEKKSELTDWVMGKFQSPVICINLYI